MKNNDIYSIRPAGRHLLTIGRDLIQNQYAAIVELVKNAYDADSPDVSISLLVPKNRKSINVVIEDHGHGMSRDTVINKWLVPSTKDKFDRRTSPNGRLMQGRKGIGRYAASILGKDLLLETITEEGEKTVVYIEWDRFEEAQYLDDVEILVETESSGQPKGTILTITADKEQISEWDNNQINKLNFELKKLISPVSWSVSDVNEDDSFAIYINFEGLFEGQIEKIEEKVEPYPIFELFDYRISGTIDKDGTGILTYANQKVKNIVEETIHLDEIIPTMCGQLIFDIRVYDRDKEAIDQLIKRGLKNKEGNYVGKLQARELLNEYNGIGVYRNGFRIRPLGDPEFDWLKLNEQRVQNPSLKIGSNQVIGYVLIQSEEQSGLKEKSARDGLSENKAYERLKEISESVIAKLEKRRFEYRKKAGLSRITLKIERDFERLFAFDELKRGIRRKLKKSGIDKKTADDIIEIISKEEEDKNKIVEDIKQIVAIYQGQATLGKIINVILHEGRRPLNYFKNQIPNFEFWTDELQTNFEPEALNDLIPIVAGLGKNSDTFVKLFSRLDPLAARKRGKRKKFNLTENINGAFHVFENELLKNKIKWDISGPEDFKWFGWHNDIYTIFTNLIDNSIFWMINKKIKKKSIMVDISVDGETCNFIDYRDTGPGIESLLIESEIIFEPEFTTKKGGTGLGLAIAGEAASRSGFELKAFDCNSGAQFRLQPKLDE